MEYMNRPEYSGAVPRRRDVRGDPVNLIGRARIQKGEASVLPNGMNDLPRSKK